MGISPILFCLALNVYHEARGEPVRDQAAVALVTMNRAGWDKRAVCKEVLKPKQFSWTNNLIYKKKGQHLLRKAGYPKNKKAWAKAVSVAQVVLDGKVDDFTNGAKFYHAYRVNPNWNNNMTITTLMNGHVFFRNDEG